MYFFICINKIFDLDNECIVIKKIIRFMSSLSEVKIVIISYV